LTARRFVNRAAVVAAIWIATALVVHAHAFAPSLLDLRESSAGEVTVTWKTPRVRVMGSDVAPVLPVNCRQSSPPAVEENESAVVLRWRVDCGVGGLIGAGIAMDGLAAANTNGLIRVALADGRVLQRVVTSTAPGLRIDAPPQPRDVWLIYARHGARHILSRVDRALFVLGLVLLAPATVPLVQAFSAFTLGHSLTLAAASLGLVAVPSGVIEIVMALTLLMLATELAREPSRTWMRRFPWIVGISFGLLHGLGFAAVLREIGLPGDLLALGVFAFNLGIEIGHVLLLMAMLVGMRLLQMLPVTFPAWARQMPVYAMGSLAAFWCFERAAALLG
jgi:hypothetical protein